MFLTEVNAFEYSHSEELGNAFEYLLQCMGIQGENGQFRTPRHIIDFMVACLDPKPGDKILDPACGTGGFLVSAYKHILRKSTSPGSAMPGDRLTHGERQKVYSNLAGYDVTDLMVKLSEVNLFLHGFPNPAIHVYDPPCPLFRSLLGAKQTCPVALHMSASDPKRTSPSRPRNIFQTIGFRTYSESPCEKTRAIDPHAQS
jgi:hypothetical protein